MGPLRGRRAGRQVEGLPEVAQAGEWRTARDALHEDDYDRAMDSLRRSHRTLQALNAAWRPIAAPAPARFGGFREASGKASGLPSAVYLHLEFPLGLVLRRRNDHATATRSAFPEIWTARGHV
ncbi:tryptophan 2,3-dioxygenase family protein [Streptomyces olivoreticuli]